MRERTQNKPVVFRSAFGDWRLRVDSDGSMVWEIPGDGKDGWVVVKRLARDESLT